MKSLNKTPDGAHRTISVLKPTGKQREAGGTWGKGKTGKQYQMYKSTFPGIVVGNKPGLTPAQGGDLGCFSCKSLPPKAVLGTRRATRPSRQHRHSCAPRERRKNGEKQGGGSHGRGLGFGPLHGRDTGCSVTLGLHTKCHLCHRTAVTRAGNSCIPHAPW